MCDSVGSGVDGPAAGARDLHNCLPQLLLTPMHRFYGDALGSYLYPIRCTYSSQGTMRYPISPL
jgi:hypothetical protein